MIPRNKVTGPGVMLFVDTTLSPTLTDPSVIQKGPYIWDGVTNCYLFYLIWKCSLLRQTSKINHVIVIALS